jgi:hypothetical protein
MSVEYQLTDNDWHGSAQAVTYNLLDSWCIGTAYHMEIADNSYNYITLTTDVGKQINDNAGGYFTTGIAGISQVRPNLFTVGQSKADVSAGTPNNAWDSATAWMVNFGSAVTADTNKMGTPFGVTGKEVICALVFIGIVILMMNSGGKPLAVVGLSMPVIWCACYFKAMPFSFLFVIIFIFALMFVRQFWWKSV